MACAGLMRCCYITNRPFAIIREDAEGLAQFGKLIFRSFKALSLCLSSIPTPITRTVTLLTEVERFTDFLLLFPSIQDFVKDKGWKAVSNWAFLATSILGTVSFLHDIAVVKLGQLARRRVDLATLGCVVVGFTAAGIEKAMQIKNPFVKAGQNHKNYQTILKVASCAISALFFTSLMISGLPAFAPAILGILAAGTSLTCVLYEHLAKEFA